MIRAKAAFHVDPRETITAQLNPSRYSQKYSATVNQVVILANCGANSARITVPNTPPATENARQTPRTSVERPARVKA